MDLNIMVGGEAGQGVQSVGFMLARAFARGSYHIFADQDYESRVRGGHNFYRIRVSDVEVGAISESIDILLALNDESVELHRDKLTDNGVIIFDAEGAASMVTGPDFAVPLAKLAEDSAGNRVMANTVALGVALGLVKYDRETMIQAVREHFGDSETGDKNVKAALEGYGIAGRYQGEFSQVAESRSNSTHMLLNGNESIALGAIAAGCPFMAAYPMTPASSIMEYLVSKSDELGLAVIQSEDEIAAINMAIGAAFAGVRAMTATSGGGFCLMVEGLGLAGITETPVVVIDAQRPGPGIGLPTRTEQSDLEFVIHPAHGEFPLAVLAPTTVEDAFWLTIKAFNLAEKFQIPVIILTDQHLASSYRTVKKFDLSKVKIDRGIFASDDHAEYRRYQVTKSGISARAFPMQSRALVVADSDEHDENGHLIESAEVRTQMMQKRLGKIQGLRDEIGSPQVYGPAKAETTLVGWGSTFGALKETVDNFRNQGKNINLIHFSEIWPFPVNSVSELLKDSREIFVVENNATGQLARVIRAETGIGVNGNILKFDGRPFSSNYIAEQLQRRGN